ncbi:MAG: hypothetical protein R3250_17665, partial [Melioribacteraceae bacterium]|nr:hypothetical protein [Melioribacteraceae bacterium]
MLKILFFLLFFITHVSIGQSRNQNFEYSGIDKFWQIVKVLEANLEPSHKEWNDLFSTPGYKILTRNEFSRSFFEENFRLVFKPNLRKELEKALNSKKNIHHLGHYIKIRDNKSLIKNQLNKIRRTGYSKK